MKNAGNEQNSLLGNGLRFIHEGSDPCLFEQLFTLWQQSERVHIAVAFLSVRMLNILMAHLRNAKAGVSVQFLTGAMNGFNEPRVLENLRKHFGEENVRLYQPKQVDAPESSNFHVKAYLFMTGDKMWTIVLGSSNLTESALLGIIDNNGYGNAEWNLLVESGSAANNTVVADILSRFDYYWNSNSIQLNEEILEAYRQKWLEKERRRERDAHQAAMDRASELLKPEARPVQRQALDRLNGFRQDGLRRAAIIGATGIGKTLISAFDVESNGAHRVLFVAHRETLLCQAAEAYRQVLGDKWMYHQIGGEKDTQEVDKIVNGGTDANGPLVVFAMIQTLKNPKVHSRFSRDYFDYLVIDEFHHASAPSYKSILHHFTPGFLLGLTATPERLDGRDVLELCDYNVALEMRLFDAVEQGSLSPFLYFAFHDATDYEKIRWTGSGYDELELEHALSNDTRAALVANTLGEHLPAFGKFKGIAFCCNTGHARYMADALTKRGFETTCILGDTPESERRILLNRLENEQDPLKLLCAVDVLSEGIDVPALTHILLLRPTQSFTVFLQQIGRGLRPHPRKEFLVILDFVGNYRKNYVAPLVLTGHAFENKALSPRGTLKFKAPKGCYIHPDTQVKRIWQNTIKTQFMRLNLKDRLRQLYEEIWNDLGQERSPRIMDFFGHPLCSDPMKFIAPGAFGNWLRVKEYCGGLSDEERAWLGTPAEAFLLHIERELNAVRSYKMVVLLSLLETSAEQTSWTVEEIASRFKLYYLESPLRCQDYDDLARSPDPTNYPLARVVNHIKNMPLKYLSDKPDKFFRLDNGMFSLKPAILCFWSQSLFRECLFDRVHFALTRYWSRKYKDADLQALVLPPTSAEKDKAEKTEPALLAFSEARDQAFISALPFVADVAAGDFKDTFGSADLSICEDMDWLEVPRKLCRRKRFVIRVAGDSMVPEFQVGDLLVFEYHRTPRRNGEVVLAADYSLGESSGTYAVKRLREDGKSWIFESTNPLYKPVIAQKAEVTYPILGTFVGKIN